MNNFGIGRLVGRLDVILEDIPNKEKDLQELERALKYEQDIESLAIFYGKIEQKMIISNKDKKEIQFLKDLFMEAEQTHIEEFKKKNINELKLRGFPLKALNNENIFTVQDLCNKTIQELENINGISDMSARRLVDVLKRNGLYLKQKYQVLNLLFFIFSCTIQILLNFFNRIFMNFLDVYNINIVNIVDIF